MARGTAGARACPTVGIELELYWDVVRLRCHSSGLDAASDADDIGMILGGEGSGFLFARNGEGARARDRGDGGSGITGGCPSPNGSISRVGYVRLRPTEFGVLVCVDGDRLGVFEDGVRDS